MKQEQKVNTPTLQVPFGDFNASLVNGKWEYKYEPANRIIIKSGDAKPVLKYKDPVQFKIMEEYEGNVEKGYKIRLAKMVLDITKYLSKV